MNDSVRKILEDRLLNVKDAEKRYLDDKDQLEDALLKNKIKLDSIVEEKKELGIFLSEYPL